MHKPYIGAWMKRHAKIIHIELAEISIDLVTLRYIQWYKSIIRRYILKFSAMDGLIVSVVYFLFILHISNFMLFNLWYLLSYTKGDTH